MLLQTEVIFFLTSQCRSYQNGSILTLGIMLSQLAAVVCKVLIQAGRGSLSLLFLL